MAPPRGAWRCLICCCLCWLVHGMVPEPQNVTLHSVMFDSVLQWDPPNFHKENMTYTVQYKDYATGFTELCNRTELTQCNISKIPVFGNFTLRVRTELEKEQSNWVDIIFNPLDDTQITSPTIHAEATKPTALNIQLTEPAITRDGGKYPLTHFYGSNSVIYRMLIWKKDFSGEQVRQVNLTRTWEIVPDLEPGTVYCLKAQAFIEFRDKSGEWSEVFCSRTTNNGISPIKLAVIILLILTLLPFSCYFILRVYRRVKYAFFPTYSLPQHFKEFLSKPYSSQLLRSQSQEDDCACDQIIVLSEQSKNDDSYSEEPLNNSSQTPQEAIFKPKNLLL
uniref:Interleukin 10 receptor subunit beta n=2 Tax=Salvator merianae TaxID=96440 RepID=A0A8D0EDU6_SALMN